MGGLQWTGVYGRSAGCDSDLRTATRSSSSSDNSRGCIEKYVSRLHTINGAWCAIGRYIIAVLIDGLRGLFWICDVWMLVFWVWFVWGCLCGDEAFVNVIEVFKSRESKEESRAMIFLSFKMLISNYPSMCCFKLSIQNDYDIVSYK